MNLIIKQSIVFSVISVILGLAPTTKALATGLQPPQQLIQEISDTLQKQLQDKSFTKDFTKVRSLSMA